MWNAAQEDPGRIYAFDPDFVDYMSSSFNLTADDGLYGMILALQRWGC